jgi:LSD1 subclass zinc finger protein
MEIDQLEIVQLELKYCESCGGLWLRPKGSNRVECAACAARPKRWLEQTARTTRPRLPRIRSLELESAQGDLPEWLPAPADWGTA